MATSRAIRDAGETLRSILLAGVAPAVPNLTIELATPDEFRDHQDPANPVITIFLHRVALHPEMRNAPLRRRPDGVATRPLLPLELSFMITPWARETADEYQLAGLVVQTFYERAEIGPAWLQGPSWEPGDSMQLVFESLGSEEHYRVWDTVDLPYRLSLTYLVRVIGIETRDEMVTSPVVTADVGSPA